MKLLPSFQRPPVVEVAMAVQFDDVPDLTGPMMGLLWSRFRDKFPRLQIHPQRSQSFENFDKDEEPPQFMLEFGSHPPPLVWYISEDDSELIQVQRNRFVFNWRRREVNYPRYNHVREEFSKYLDAFRDFLATEGIAGKLHTNQWEVTYFNHVQRCSVWQEHSDLGMVIPSWKHRPSDDFLPDPEDVTLNFRYRINDQGNETGRLHVVAQPTFTVTEREPIILLRLTARGPLTGTEVTDSLVGYLDLGREWIVRGFASITSRQMHEHWKREE